MISRFDAEHRRPNWIPYSITCTVLRDEATAILELPISLAASAAQDFAIAASLAPVSPPPAGLNAQLATTSDLTQAPILAGAAAQQAASNGYFQRANRNVATA